MTRNAFIMHLHAGAEAEYRRRHDLIWPELKEELRKAGISNYSIYLDKKTNTLFAYQELAEDSSGSDLPESPIVRKWWHSMKDLMDTNQDESPVCDSAGEVFHMD